MRDSDPLVTVVSDTLIISTGLADQNSISLSVDTFNPEGLDYNNVEVEVVFQAADHFNNFVPDGTVVYFTTELGSIDDSCTLEDGVCTAIWRSGNPRSSYCDQNGLCLPGISTITAFLIGEESFTDFNGNGYFDPGDEFEETTDMGEPFRDDDYPDINHPNFPEEWHSNGYQHFEPWWDFGDGDGYEGKPNGIYDESNGIYNGSLCSDEAKASGECTKELVYVQASAYIVMSGSFVHTFTLAVGQSPGIWIVTITDKNGNPMPAGSDVEIERTSDQKIVGSFKIPNTLTPTYSVCLEETGVLRAKITTPFGNISYSDNTVTIN